MTAALKTRRRVVIIDDHTALVELLEFALGNLDDLDCVGKAGSMAEAEQVVAEHVPDLVLVDLMLGEDDGLQLVRRLRYAHPELVIVVASARSDATTMTEVAAAGGNGFAPKRGAFTELVGILRSARTGTMAVASSLQAVETPSAAERIPVPLTLRETEVLELMGRGTSVAGIAELLNITLSTTRTYVRAVHSKLGVRSQLEAVLKARGLGLIDPVDGR